MKLKSRLYLIVLIMLSFQLNAQHMTKQEATEWKKRIRSLTPEQYKSLIDENKSLKGQVSSLRAHSTNVIQKLNENNLELDKIKSQLKYSENANVEQLETDIQNLSNENYRLKQELAELRGVENVETAPSIEIEGDYGMLSVTSNQSNVRIYVDNIEIGSVNGNKPFNKRLPTGKHTVRAVKQFFMPITVNLDIANKDISKYHFSLEEAKGFDEEQAEEKVAEQSRGELVIMTERTDYKIEFKEIGLKRSAPLELTEFPSGVYNITITAPGFSRTRKIVIKHNERTFIDLDRDYNR